MKNLNIKKLSKKKIILFILLANICFFLVLEFGTRSLLNFLNLPTKQKYANIDSSNYNFLTGYYNEPFENEAYNQEKAIQQLATDRYGFSLDGLESQDRDLTKKEKCEYRVFVLGGSTVQGRYLENNLDTIPSKLKAILNKKFRNYKVSFNVVNAGESSIISSQELALYLYKIKFALKPDHIIFFNGVNDFINPIYNVDKTISNSHKFQREFEKMIKKSSSNILYHFDAILSENLSLYFLIKKTLIKSKRKVFSISKDQDSKTSDYKLKEKIYFHTERYFYNIDVVAKLSSQTTKNSVFFQPSLLPENLNKMSKDEKKIYENAKSYKWASSPFMKAKQGYYDIIRDEIQNKKEIYNKYKNFQLVDLSRIFLNKEQKNTYYGDHVHYLPISRAIIAENISMNIISIIEQDLTSNFKACMKNKI
jgi:hypothetical protein